MQDIEFREQSFIIQQSRLPGLRAELSLGYFLGTDEFSRPRRIGLADGSLDISNTAVDVALGDAIFPFQSVQRTVVSGMDLLELGPFPCEATESFASNESTRACSSEKKRSTTKDVGINVPIYL